MLTKLKFPTLYYQYDNDELEFVFCVKGKPFPCLISPRFPTPDESLIDYQMVRELGLKMTDLQCKKFRFAEHDMRVLGVVKTSVQCITDGAVCGSTTIIANVIQNLTKNTDAEFIAGQKMAKQLRGSICTPSGALSPSRATTPPPRPSPSPTKARTPPPPKTRHATTPHSPPGFPAKPQHSPPRPTPPAPPSPFSHNIRRLESMFADADLYPQRSGELSTLWSLDKNAEVNVNDGVLTFSKSDGTYYETGHGRYKCSRLRCVTEGQTVMPDNCAYNIGQYQVPVQFKPCGADCRRAFCKCLRNYI